MSIIYNIKMDITNWNNDEILRLITARGHVTQKDLLKLLKEKCNKEIPQSTFSCKIRNGNLKVNELQNLCQLLGYSIFIEPNK